jgi:hypothetical protein
MVSYNVIDFDGSDATLATSIDNYTLGSGSFTIQLLIRRNQPGVGADFPWYFATSGGNLNFFELGAGGPGQQYNWDSNGILTSTNADDRWIFYDLAYDASTGVASYCTADITDSLNSDNINFGNFVLTNWGSVGPGFGPFTSGTNPFTLGNNLGGAFIGRIFGGAAYNTAHATDPATVQTDIESIIWLTIYPDCIYLFTGEDGSHITEYVTGHNMSLSEGAGITFPSIDVSQAISITITETAQAIDSVSAGIPIILPTEIAHAIDTISILPIITILESAHAIDNISIITPPSYITISDFAYAEDNISINRGATAICPMPSGAYPLSPMEKDYINLSYQQIIDMSGLPITYRIATIVGTDKYEHPIITYTDKTIVAFITILGNDEYEYVEPGFLPNHYAVMWVYCVTPQVGDHVVWQSIEWEVRNSIPKVIGGDTVYYQTILRRVLARVPLTGEIGDGTNLGDTTGTGGTLKSGGVQYPPQGDP